MKTENGVTTYYIYGLGLIYETTETDCKVYHYDYRGSTVALTDTDGNVTDRFAYDTYGKLTTRTGTSSTQFLYNGRDGVMTDENGLVYMRARYYSPTLKRFLNADVVAGSITNAITLNRYAYANGNPVSNVDPFGLSAETPSVLEAAYMAKHIYNATISDRHKPLGDNFGGWMLERIHTNSEGLKIGVYYKIENNVKSYTIVNEGSSSWIDWKNNFEQPFGRSKDMADSIAYVEQFVDEHSNTNITFVGHSKGGAEAAANAVATNKNAILFNPATASLGAYGLDSGDYTADMTAYIVDGDLLNEIFAFISVPIDEVEYIGEDSYWNTLLNRVIPITTLIEGCEDHSINTVIENLCKK